MLDWYITQKDGGPSKTMRELSSFELNVVEAALRNGYASTDNEGGVDAALQRVALEREIRSRSR